MSISPRPLPSLCLLAALVAATASAPPPRAPRPRPPVPVRAVAAAVPCPPGRAVPSDFDGDGTADLAVASPQAGARAGMIALLYGTRRADWLSEPGPPGRGVGVGAAVAAVDADHDRCADLAVGVPDAAAGRRPPGAEGEGAVRIFHGSPGGLRPGRRLALRPDGTDRFGTALAAADRARDRDDELVVGAPGHAGGGAVAVFGLRGRGLRRGPVVTRRTGWVGGGTAETDAFGTVLTCGDYDGDRRDEIAVGAPGDGAKGEGAVTVLDVLERSSTRLAQDSAGTAGTPERLDAFGAALASGDFDRDGHDDVAVGVPGESLTDAGRIEGAVQIFAGPSLAQRGPTLTPGARRFHRFGSALAAGDLTGDGTADLAVGAPGGGEVRVLRGVPDRGLAARSARTLTSPFGSGAQFGWALAIRNGELAVGAPGARSFGGAATLTARPPNTADALPLTPAGLLGYAFA
ncbi:FG-GAP repeat protein [Actinomadura yumaensis]|uniref:FG-GAP repeat protein n=1 Tax=Actinomadura yumaensis TaxID=111807 RepID=A0ABW2CJT1_9ACTN